ncbi:MAG: NAD-dependent epimerase/dehydratase family protein [Desulfobia sp.]
MILVTGAGGFIGRGLCSHLKEKGYRYTPAVKKIGAGTDWSALLTDSDQVIHLAAATDSGKLTEEQRQRLWVTNVEGTYGLACQAAAAGIKRFIYLSSAKVNGDRSSRGPFREEDQPGPGDCYSRSKLKAEERLKAVSAQTGMETVIIRPPLVYGAGVKGNFLRLLNWLDKGIPLPFAGLDNRRSLLGLTNLIHFITLCLEHPEAGNKTFLVSDMEDLSTPELIRRLAFYLGKSPRLFPVPCRLLQYSGLLLGKKGEMDRLCASFRIDAGRAGETLSWSPPLSVNEELKKTVSWYRNNA